MVNPEAHLSFSDPKQAWVVVYLGEVHGVLVKFEEQGGARHFFSVRNTLQQELGMVDSQGRAWRYVVHEDEPEWVGSGTVEQGAGLILGLDRAAELFEVSVELLVDGSARE
ncbi:MAG: hypothetical protein ACI8X5_002313 [Planctomycetota bacterium]|jgi:hypothetical protein